MLEDFAWGARRFVGGLSTRAAWERYARFAATTAADAGERAEGGAGGGVDGAAPPPRAAEGRRNDGEAGDAAELDDGRRSEPKLGGVLAGLHGSNATAVTAGSEHRGGGGGAAWARASGALTFHTVLPERMAELRALFSPEVDRSWIERWKEGVDV